MSIADRLAEVRARLDAAARSVGRDPSSVRLVAVSKTFPGEAVRAAFQAGQLDFGENKVQEALQKTQVTADLSIRWHMLGHLQSNKARKAVQTFDVIQSVDSVDLLKRIDAAAADEGCRPELLIQVNLAGETRKFGVPTDDVPALLEAGTHCRASRVVGLMMLPPAPETAEDARPWFQRLRALRDEWMGRGVAPEMLRELSMGMSGDYEVAVQEGATIVRVGTAIFGRR